MKDPNHFFDSLISTIAKLRDPKKGCPWDLKQNHQSLIKYLIEEAYECSFALKTNDYQHMEEELGDVLLQVILHAQIASEKNNFDIKSISKKLEQKIIRRHPHVFEMNNEKKPSLEELDKQWDQIKKSEGKKDEKSLINLDILNTTSLIASQKIGKKTKTLNFDWKEIKDVIKKVKEEVQELEEAIEKNDLENTYEELGDLLFSVAQVSRHLEIDSETALADANHKFLKRFNRCGKISGLNKEEFKNLSSDKKEKLWQKVKNEKTL